jgi:hypothetical protein
MLNDIWGLLSKKKKSSTLSISVKPTQTVEPTNTAPTATPQAKPVKPIKMKAKPHKVKKVQVQQASQAKVKVQQTQQVQKYNLADIKLATNADALGIHIFVLYQNQPVHQITLLKIHYVLWNQASPQTKYNFIKSQINPVVFGNDANLVHQVVLTACNILNTLFAEAA